MDAPRDNLTRSVPFTVERADGTGDGLTLEGYAAVFDSPTEIRSWEGEFVETIKRGAFARTIEHRTPVLQFDHGQHPLIGSIPLGTIKHMREDERGLFVRARLSDNWLIQPVRDAIAEGAVDGMSFRMNVKQDKWTPATRNGDLPRREITEVACPELGPVVFPAYLDTAVGVRSAELDSLAAMFGVPVDSLIEFRRLILRSTDDLGHTATSPLPSITPDPLVTQHSGAPVEAAERLFRNRTPLKESTRDQAHR